MNKQRIIGKSIAAIISIILLIIISSTAVSGEVTLYSPENNTNTNEQNIIFEYYLNLNNATECSLILDTETKTTETNLSNPGFNEFSEGIDSGTHTWSVTCNTINSSEASEERTITIDQIKPTIILVSPLNNTQINQSSADITFIVINTPAENSTCKIILDGEVNKTITAEDSNPTTTSLTELDEGMHEWKITCYDQANNTETSETRKFNINTSSPDPEFNISIEKTEFEIGEYGLMTISAPNGTSIRVEVCPDQPGFVECEVPVIGENIMNYPFQEYLPFTNYEGTYILEAYFNYSDNTEIQILNYEVQNNINIGLEADDNAREHVPVIIKAEVSGGVGELTYTWHLSNDSTIENQTEINVTYDEAGNYTETISVKDEYNNTKNKSITIDVSSAYEITIFVKDSETDQAIPDATIEIEDEEKETGSDGKASFYLRKRKSDIIILKEGYEIYLDELNITQDETFTILLTPLNSTGTQPNIILIRPENNSVIQGPEGELVFKAEHNNDLNCSIYINENNDGFFIYMGSMQVTDNSEQIFDITEIENKTYWWKVECTDTQGNTDMSETWKFTAGNPDTLIQTFDNAELSQGLKKYSDLVKDFEQILSELEALPSDEKQAAEALGIISTLKNTIQTFKNTARDIDSLNFRNDLSEAEKEAEKENIISIAEEAYKKTPIRFEIINSDAFVDYISNEELNELLEEFIKLKDIDPKINQKKLLTFLEELQQEIVISTKIKIARIMYADETQQEISAVIREIKTYNLTPGSFIIEVIPKDVISTADEIMSSQEFEVIKQDPIISFGLKGDTVLTYYFEKNIDVELLKNIKTALFPDLESLDQDKITGFATKGIKLPKLKGIIFIPLTIILLGGLVFIGIKYNGLYAAKYMIYKVYGHKSLHYINVILTDINDNLETGETEKALQLYEEAKGAYQGLSSIAKNEVYARIIETAEKIKNYCQVTQNQEDLEEIKQMIINITGMLNQGELRPALEKYKRIESAYNQLSQEKKEMFHPVLTSLGAKIQVVIDSSIDR